MSFPSIINRGEFFSDHYLESVIASDLNDLRQRWEAEEKGDVPTGRARIRSMSRQFFAARGGAEEGRGTNRAADTARALNDVVLAALGFEADRTELELAKASDTLSFTAAHLAETSTGPLLVALDAHFATDVDELFGATGDDDAVELVDSIERSADNKRVRIPADAVGEIFGCDDPPRYVLVVAGTVAMLAERARWAEGRFLAVDFDGALERNDTKAKGELETIAALFSADVLMPDDGQSVLDELVDNSHKHAVGVSKELRTGLRESVEILANEVVQQRRDRAERQHRKLDEYGDARELTLQCLRYLYRLIVLLYAESRPELGILPARDDAYMEGYSLDRLRELVLVELETGHARDGSHLYESLDTLFELVNNGYHADSAEQALTFDDGGDDLRSSEEYLQFPGLDAALFEPGATALINDVTLRNEPLQQVLKKLMWAEGKGRKGSAGFISYAQLGINQIGAVYEGLMAYSGFYADEDLYEVAKNGDPDDGTWMLPVDQANEYPDDVFVTRTDPVTGAEERVLHEKGSFVYRLSGRDRQRSASYYTPEVLTRCVVKHALAELLGTDDYAPENGSSGITSAVDILDLTICEPALGSGAFANEAINQLSAIYLDRRSAELGESLDPERYRVELQKVKAHFALHQTYGVDLNSTAVELAEVSLWLNAMYPGLKAPWFGLQLRQGNSLIGCRRATWTVDQLAKKPWKETNKTKVAPPTDRPLDTPLATNEIHHFLLPGHGWAAVAGRKEAKELREAETAALKEWRNTILKAPSANDGKRLTQLAAAVEELWKLAAARIDATQQQLRRPIDVYGTEPATGRAATSRDDAYGAILNPDTALGRLRTVMNAWVGLWFWPLDTGTTPPTWNQWLQVIEALVRPDETHGLAGQLDIFADYQAMLDADAARNDGHPTLQDLRTEHPWLAVALDAAEREGAWHWDLEFAPVFTQGGFDLQVGNPPWVRLDWNDDLVLAEHDPWWGITNKPPTATQKQRRADNLTTPATQTGYLTELASAEGIVDYLGSPILRNILTGTRTNLYMVFMDTVWRHANPTGIAALLHPESHFTDPKAAALRSSAYRQLERHLQFSNLLALFEDVAVTGGNVFSANVYASQTSRISFVQASSLLHPSTIDGSFGHDGSGALPGIMHPWGEWDLRPHRARLVQIDEDVLSDWAELFDEPGTPPSEARLLRPVTVADLEALSVLAAQPVRLADHVYHWTQGWNETNARADGIIYWETKVPDSWDEVILQGPHFTIATPFNKFPNDPCRNNQDYSEWDLENLPEHVIPRTNYQRACSRANYDASLNHWGGEPSSDRWRVVWRKMTQPGLERSFHAALIPPGPEHIEGVRSLALGDDRRTTTLAGLWSTLPWDYLVKVNGAANVTVSVLDPTPVSFGHQLLGSVLLRTLRLNCLTSDYAPLWGELFHPAWNKDQWTDPALRRCELGGVGSEWSMDTPLRRDFERRLALVELDALAALVLDLDAEQLCAMYRSQFAVLRKYEHRMAFDAAGRKICGYHQSAGYRQSQLQEQAKAGDLPSEWKSIWKLYEQYEEDPDSVDWMGFYTPPFTRPDREAEMTQAYNEFQRRLDAGEYDAKDS